MATEFVLPDIGEGLTEGQIVKWLVAVGDPVGLDDPLVEVETAKAVVEIPSPVAGIVLHHGAVEGETLDVGQILAVIGQPGETWGRPDGVESAPPPEAPLVGTLSDDAEDLSAARPGIAPIAGRPQALPLVRRLARQLDVDLDAVAGTGPGGQITRDDVQSAAQRPPQTSEGAVPAVERGGDERVKMSMLRKTIAEHMTRSWSEIPHVTTFDDVDATRLLAVRRALSSRHGVAVPIEALVIKAVIPALRTFRQFNATLDGDELILHAAMDIGLAVDTGDGLLVPVVRAADRSSPMELAGVIADLANRGQERTLTPAELSGGTFTVSNIGAVGGGFGTPIIPHGTTAILSIGRAADAAVVRDGQVAVAPMMPLSLSYDHRVIDGGLGRRFTQMLVENLEEPALFLA